MTLAIYHTGHGGDRLGARDSIQALVEAGFDVITISMPLTGRNPKPVVEIDNIGLIRLQDHDWMEFLDCSLRFFLEPVAAAINYATAQKEYGRIVLVGLSGGGWSVTVYLAMDPRVSRTYQAAGTMPMYLRSAVEGQYGGRLGDFGQSYVPLLKTANYSGDVRPWSERLGAQASADHQPVRLRG